MGRFTMVSALLYPIPDPPPIANCVCRYRGEEVQVEEDWWGKGEGGWGGEGG